MYSGRKRSASEAGLTDPGPLKRRKTLDGWVGTLVASGSQTTAHMSHPLTAGTSDTAGLDSAYVTRQTTLREVMKQQTNTAAQSIGLPISTETQSMDSAKQKLVRPSSPLRL